MPKHNRRQKAHPGRLIRNMIGQPPALFYGRANLYWCGREMEVEHFSHIREFGDGYLKLALREGALLVAGDDLTIAALEKGRILLRGRFLRVEFLYETGGGRCGK